LHVPSDFARPVPVVSGKTVCITSRRRGEGKTFVALRVGTTLAQLGLRVCLVDLGLGPESLSTLCAPQAVRHAGEAEMGDGEDAVLVLAPGLHLFPASAELVERAGEDQGIERIVEVLERLRPDYDLVLVDCGSDALGWCYPLWSRADALVAVVCPATITPDLSWSVAAWIGHPDIASLFVLNKARPCGEDVSRLEGLAAGISRLRFGGHAMVLGQLFVDEEAAARLRTGEGAALPAEAADRIARELLSALECGSVAQRVAGGRSAPATPQEFAAAAGGLREATGYGRFVRDLAEGFVSEAVFLDHLRQLLAAYGEGFGLTRGEAVRRLLSRIAGRPRGPEFLAELAAAVGAMPPAAAMAGEGLVSNDLAEEEYRTLYRKLREGYRSRFDKDLHNPVVDLLVQIAAPGYRKEQFYVLHKLLLRAFAKRFGSTYRESKQARIDGGGAKQPAAGAAPDENASLPGQETAPPAVEPALPSRPPRPAGNGGQWGLVAVVAGFVPLSPSPPLTPVARVPVLPVLPSQPAPVVAVPGPPVELAVPVGEPAPVPEVLPEAAPAAATPSAPAAPADGLARLTIEAHQDCWVSVEDRNGRSLGRELIPSGATRSYAGSGPLRIMLGNAFGVSVRVNGVVVDPQRFQRRRVAHLTLPAEP